MMRVTTVDPSFGMIRLLYEEMRNRDIYSISVDERKWDDIFLSQVKGYYLIIASDSLHLTEIVLINELKEVFASRPKNINRGRTF